MPYYLLFLIFAALTCGCAQTDAQSANARYEKNVKIYGPAEAMRIKVRERLEAEVAGDAAQAETALLALGDRRKDLEESRAICMKLLEGRQRQTGASLRDFEVVARKVRGRQLDALHDELIAQQLDRVASGSPMINAPMFFAPYDYDHRTFLEFREIGLAASARAQQEDWYRKDMERSQFVAGMIGALFAGDLAKARIDQSYRDDGICPRCRGNKEIEEQVYISCSYCSGTSTSFNPGNGILCVVCHGLGSLFHSSETSTWPDRDGPGDFY